MTIRNKLEALKCRVHEDLQKSLKSDYAAMVKDHPQGAEVSKWVAEKSRPWTVEANPVELGKPEDTKKSESWTVEAMELSKAGKPMFTVEAGPFSQTMWRATGNHPADHSEGQYGKGHYSVGSKDEVFVFSEPHHSIYSMNVSHPKVLHVHESDLSGDGLENTAMLRAINKHLGTKHENFDSLHAGLKSEGYGGLAVHYRRGKEFIGYGDHLGAVRLVEGPESTDPLEKGFKELTVGAALAAGLVSASPLSASQEKPAPIKAEVPSSIKVDKPELHEELKHISFIESSSGKNKNHKTVESGLNTGHTAGGSTGLMPLTIKDIVRQNPSLHQKYGHLRGMSADEITDFTNKNEHAESEIANAHWNRLINIFPNSPSRRAYAWRRGITASLKASDEKVESHPYVKKFNELRGASKPVYAQMGKSEGLEKRDYYGRGLPHGWISPKGEFHEMNPDEDHREAIAGHINMPMQHDDDESPVEEGYKKGWVSFGHAGEMNIQGHHEVLNNRSHPAMRTARKIVSAALDNAPDESELTVHHFHPETGSKMSSADSAHFARHGTFKPTMMKSQSFGHALSAPASRVGGQAVSIPKEEFIDEHERLIDVLESPSHKDDKQEAKKQKKELAKVDIMEQGALQGWISPKGEFHPVEGDEDHFQFIARTRNLDPMEVGEAHLRTAYNDGYLSLGHAGGHNIVGSKKVLSDARNPAMKKARELLRLSSSPEVEITEVESNKPLKACTSTLCRYGKIRPLRKSERLKERLLADDTKEGRKLRARAGLLRALKELKVKNPGIDWAKLFPKNSLKAKDLRKALNEIGEQLEKMSRPSIKFPGLPKLSTRPDQEVQILETGRQKNIFGRKVAQAYDASASQEWKSKNAKAVSGQFSRRALGINYNSKTGSKAAAIAGKLRSKFEEGDEEDQTKLREHKERRRAAVAEYNAKADAWIAEEKRLRSAHYSAKTQDEIKSTYTAFMEHRKNAPKWKAPRKPANKKKATKDLSLEEMKARGRGVESTIHHEALHHTLGEMRRHYGEKFGNLVRSGLVVQFHPDAMNHVRTFITEKKGYKRSHPNFQEELLTHARDILVNPKTRKSFSEHVGEKAGDTIKQLKTGLQAAYNYAKTVRPPKDES